MLIAKILILSASLRLCTGFFIFYEGLLWSRANYFEQIVKVAALM